MPWKKNMIYAETVLLKQRREIWYILLSVPFYSGDSCKLYFLYWYQRDKREGKYFRSRVMGRKHLTNFNNSPYCPKLKKMAVPPLSSSPLISWLLLRIQIPAVWRICTMLNHLFYQSVSQFLLCMQCLCRCVMISLPVENLNEPIVLCWL